MKKLMAGVCLLVLGLALPGLLFPRAVSDKAKDEAKVYAESLEAMRGEEFSKFADKLGEWKFELIQAWEEENPTPQVVGKYSRGKVKFSKGEVKDIFAVGGKFRVAIYNKLVEKGWATLGAIDDMGVSVGKDAEIQVEKYCVIRVVFKDNKMVHFRVWPKLEQSGFSGGTWRERNTMKPRE